MTIRQIGIAVVMFSFLVAGLGFAQQPTRLLRPPPPGGLPVIPFMEGWYANDDGSVTVSFGYHNRNEDDIIVPIGEGNRIEPLLLDGMQPEIYYSGRHTGVFGVTVPESMLEDSIWWYLKTGDLEELSVPGGLGSEAYELDRRARPQGSVQPYIWFSDDDDERGSGPEGILASDTITVSLNESVTIEVQTEDPSVRDPLNPLFAKPLDTRVIWYKHQGPGDVSFSEHHSTPFDTGPTRSTRGMIPVADSRVIVPQGKGPARVNAIFSEPGEYMIRARLDNWASSDSDGLDQCCWSNAYQRVRVID